SAKPWHSLRSRCTLSEESCTLGERCSTISEEDCTPASAPGEAERSDSRCVVCLALFDIVADVPDRAVVDGIDRGLRVIFPAHRVLRRLALDQHALAKRQQSRRIVRQPRGKSLARMVRRAAERIADCDIALPIDRGAGHPPKKPVRRIGALLM